MVKTRSASENKIICPSMMFVGDAGSGKTSLLGQAAKFHVNRTGGKKFLILNHEPKDRTATPSMLSCPKEVEIADNLKWAEIQEVFATAPQQYQAGLGIDGWDMYVRESFYDILGIAGSPRFNIGQTFMGNQNAWHIQGHRMLNHFRILLDKGIPIVATCRLAYDKDDLTGQIFMRTCAEGKSGVEVPPLFTVLGLCKYKGGEKWVVAFRPEHRFPARDTGGNLNPEEPADYALIWNKVTGVIPPDAGKTEPPKITPAGGK